MNWRREDIQYKKMDAQLLSHIRVTSMINVDFYRFQQVRAINFCQTKSIRSAAINSTLYLTSFKCQCASVHAIDFFRHFRHCSHLNLVSRTKCTTLLNNDEKTKTTTTTKQNYSRATPITNDFPFDPFSNSLNSMQTYIWAGMVRWKLLLCATHAHHSSSAKRDGAPILTR